MLLRLTLPFFIPALGGRIWSAWAEAVGTGVWAGFLRGTLADALMSLVLACCFASRRIWLSFPAFAFAALVYAGNIYHVHVNAANIDAYTARLGLTREFAEGSIFSFGLVSMALAMFVLSTGLSIWLWRELRPAWRLRLTAGVIALALTAILPTAAVRPDWVQRNVFEQNFTVYIVGALTGSERLGAGETADPALYERFLGRDVDGALRVALPAARPNVLLVLFEGLSQQHLNDGLAPYLNDLTKHGLHFRQFVSHQRQTNRGLYATFCADYPNFRDRAAKSDIASSGRTRPGQAPCLPALMSANGYRTVFMQGAKLDFMNKRGFARYAGFQEALGANELSARHRRYGWGVDDLALFEEVGQKIAALEQEDDPWFLGVLTLGTHHPYLVPEGFSFSDNAHGFARPLQVAAEGLRRLLETLAQQGVLDRTLVLLTSDESAAWAGDLSGELWSNWSTLVALLPDGVTGVVDELYGQIDIANSVLDYAGLLSAATPLPGRSLFRQPTRPREILFGHNYTRHFYAYDEKSSGLLACQADRVECEAYTTAVSGRVFDVDLRPAAVEAGAIEDVYRFVAASDMSIVDRTGYAFRRRHVDVTAPTVFMSAFAIELQPGETARWKIAIDELQEGNARVELRIGDTGDRKFANFTVKHVFRGQSFDYEFEHEVTENTLYWTYLAVTPQPDTTLRVSEVYVEKMQGQSITPANVSDVSSPMGRSLDRPVDLLRNADMRFHDCLWPRVLEGQGAIRADTCPARRALAYGPYWRVTSATALAAEAVVSVESGAAEFAVELVDKQGTRLYRAARVTPGSRAIIAGATEAVSDVEKLEARLWLLDYEPQTIFHIDRFRLAGSRFMPEPFGTVALPYSSQLRLPDCARVEADGSIVYDDVSTCAPGMALAWGPYWDVAKNSRVEVVVIGQSSAASKSLRLDMYANNGIFSQNATHFTEGESFTLNLLVDVASDSEGVEIRLWDDMPETGGNLKISEFFVHIAPIPLKPCRWPWFCKNDLR